MPLLFERDFDPVTGFALVYGTLGSDRENAFGAIEGGFLVAGSNDLEAVHDNSGVRQGLRFDRSASPAAASVLALDDGRFVHIERGGSGVGMQYVRPDDGALTVIAVPNGLSESTPQNNLVALISMAGAALNSSYTFSVVSDSLGGAFRIEGNRLILDAIDGLDYETAPTVSVTIAATDLNGVTSTQIVALDVIDEALEYPITASPALADTVDTTDRGLLELASGGHVLAASAHGVDPTGTAVTVQSFDAAGNPTSPVVQVNTQTFLNQQDPDIAALAGGRLMIAWWDQGGETAGGIRYQLFDSSLSRIGPEFTLNTVKNGVQIDVALQQLGSGRVLATWSDYSGVGGDTISGGIKGQLFDSAGVPVGGEFLVNGVVAGEQRKSDVIALASGNVLVTWASVDTATAGTLRGQLFDSDGARVGGEILLESFTRDGGIGTYSAQNSGGYKVVALASGGFALAWTTDGTVFPDRSGTAVWARLFDDNGAAVNAKFLVNTVPDGNQRVWGMTVLPSGELYIAWQNDSTFQARIFDLTATRTDWADDDISSGTPGADVLGGGPGDDTYIVNHAGDVVIEFASEGTDIVYSAVSYSLNGGSEVESLSTITWELTDPLNLNGNSLNNQLIGNAGVNRLDGRDGTDTMFGREGNDIYFVDNAGDRPIEYAGQGSDVVYTSVSYALAANTEIEGLATISFEATNALNLTGNGLANNMIGNDGANQLDGKGGADTMTGRAGNDKYLVDNAGDRVFEAAGGGTDVVYTGVSFVLTDAQEIEGLSTITWELTTAINLTGNGLKNNIIGNAGANVLDGKGGNDSLQGREGADSYAFTTVLGAGNIDVILGFSSADDTILLENNGVFVGLAVGALNANAFVIGTAAQDSSDRIIYNQATGQLFFDADGNGAGAQVQFAALQGAPIIAAGDFTVI